VRCPESLEPEFLKGLVREGQTSRNTEWGPQLGLSRSWAKARFRRWVQPRIPRGKGPAIH